ncbi:hypothetical protein J437_LFUL007183 [Ladona fulva]|uniref:EF-hand domain-containing protein n=1 Tax=Ladona fulva TaxID=123851 RepID=A0A8K0K4P2_LADFU|nr:hypothetical protein J437_LFUL007183 [Ladona fulva]
MGDAGQKTKRKKSSTGDAAAEKPPRKESTDSRPGDLIKFYEPPKIPHREEDVLHEIDEKKLLELREAFFLLDLNNDGYIDKEDLRMTYATLGRPDMPERDIDHMLGEAICNPLDFDSFVILLGFRTIELDPEETLIQALSSWDLDDSGLICEERIKHDLMTWGEKFTPEEVDMALEDAPTYAKGEKVMIDYIEFCKKLCGLRKSK